MKKSIFLFLTLTVFVCSIYSQQQNKRWQDIYAKYYQIEDNETDIKTVRNWGIAVTSLSAVSYVVAMPAIAVKMNNEAIDYATGKTDIDNVNKWSKKKTKAMAITSFVCGVGVLAGVSCLIYYHNNNAPGIAIYDGLYIRDNGLGVSVTKTF